MSKRTALAKACVNSLHYKNEHSLSFEKYMEFLTKAFTMLEKDKMSGSQITRRWSNLSRESTLEMPSCMQAR